VTNLSKNPEWSVPPQLEGNKMVTLADLKKNRTTDFSKLTKALESTGQKESGDDSFWRLERDKAGNGSATIRFLPAFPGNETFPADELPWVKKYSHSFQGPTGRWYIEDCRSTIGEDDPVNDANRELWKGSEKDKEVARNQKRKLAYICQILVVSDPKKPENNGKVFFYKFGKKIFDKIMDAAKPTFEDEKPVNVFDLWEGANFKLRIKTVEGYPNYDSSAFEAPGQVAEDDSDILEIVKQQKPLAPFVDPKNFKSYEELEKKFKSVMSAATGNTKKAEDIAKEMAEASLAPKTQTEKPKVEVPTAEKPKVERPAADEDDIDAFFASIDND
jgi:hypothetical protein